MESQYSSSSGNRMLESGREKDLEVVAANKKKMRGCDLFIRVAAAVLTLAAAVVLGVDKQTTTVPLTLVPTLPPVNVPVSAKWHYASAFVYFVVVNAISSLYAVISSLVILINKGKIKGTALMIIISDLIIVALLFSGTGAALAVGLISKYGNSHLQWKKLCFVVERFCNQGAVALGFSIVASLVFFLLVVIGILKLYKNH